MVSLRNSSKCTVGAAGWGAGGNIGRRTDGVFVTGGGDISEVHVTAGSRINASLLAEDASRRATVAVEIESNSGSVTFGSGLRSSNSSIRHPATDAAGEPTKKLTFWKGVGRVCHPVSQLISSSFCT